MSTTRSNKRLQLVQAACNLVHQRGFNRTTLADIADEAGVRLGNVYYYFKTKSEIAQAIVEQRASEYQMLLQSWDQLPDPKERLSAFLQRACDNRSLLARSGCPIGMLCGDLRKEDGELSKDSARKAGKLFGPILTWLEAQFRAFGFESEAAGLAVHLLSAMQGASLLTHSFGRQSYIVEEAERLREWIDDLSTARSSRAAKRRA